MKISRSKWSNILFFILLGLLIFPNTRKPIQIAVNRIFAFSPSVNTKDERQKINPLQYKLRGMDGSINSLPIAQGDIILLNYWATWCAPCIAEMPSLQKLYDDYADKIKFAFITNEEREVINEFLSKKGYDFPVYLATNTRPEKLMHKSIPTTFLIDKNGTILIKKTGAANWNSDSVRALIDSLLSQ
tara:strand:+ start:1146 stop:1706 length:561 start_codon:yes stop_codon:yes gene_type:complete